MFKHSRYALIFALISLASTAMAAGVSSKIYLSNHSNNTVLAQGHEVRAGAHSFKIQEFKDSALLYRDRSYTHAIVVRNQQGKTVCHVHESITTAFSAGNLVNGGIPGLNFGPKLMHIDAWSAEPECMVEMNNKMGVFLGDTAIIDINYYADSND